MIKNEPSRNILWSQGNVDRYAECEQQQAKSRPFYPPAPRRAGKLLNVVERDSRKFLRPRGKPLGILKGRGSIIVLLLVIIKSF